MRVTRSAAVLLTAALLAASMAGCRRAPQPTVDDAPFKAAIAQYLAAKSMGMAVAEFKSLDVNGDSAEAVCRMREASAMHRVSVTWRFAFARGADGKWKVIAHETR